MLRLFGFFTPASTLALLAVEILLSGLSFLAGTYAAFSLAFDRDTAAYVLYENGALAIVIVTFCFIFGLFWAGLYADVYVKSKTLLLIRVTTVTGSVFLIEGFIRAVAPQFGLPLHALVAGSVPCVALVITWRLLFSRITTQILGNTSLLLVGTEPVVAALGNFIATHPKSGFRVAGYVQDEPGDFLSGVPRLGLAASLTDIVRDAQPGHVVVGTGRRAANTEFVRVLKHLRYGGQKVEEAAKMYESVCGRVWVRDIEPTDLIYTNRFNAPGGHLFLQRFVHPVIALIALTVFLPLMSLVWLILRVRLSGPVIERQERVGLNNKCFTQYRFRIASADPVEPTALLDPVAAIRRFHLDALPQLVNILKGDMAFVGPRPDRPEFVEVLREKIPYYPHRHCVRPGMTGWAQIQIGLSLTDTMGALEYDLYYVKNASCSLDAFILFQTLRPMFP